MKTYVFIIFFIVYVHSTLSAANIGIFMDSSSWNNCSLNSQELTTSRH